MPFSFDWNGRIDRILWRFSIGMLPLSAQVVMTLTPTQASDITAPMVTGIQTAGTDVSAIESVISATMGSAAQSFSTVAASVFQAVVSASTTSGVPSVAIGTGIAPSVVLLAGNPAAARLAVAQAAAAPSVMNAAELAAIPTAANNTNGFGVGGIATTSVTQC